ncbi:MAG: hypothetical protein H0V01_12455 [Bacteroidetes bacterium]|nr:hypothetical protein [Bacteroidota bacterium]HET6245872.1 hypothetical protein [Bacteroidia bacterium]
MKKIKLILATLFLFSSVFVYAQKKKSFEGVIVFDISVDADEMDPMTKAMLAGMELKTYLKNEKSRSESSMAMQKSITLSDSKAKTVVTLLEIMGQKFMIKTSPEDLTKLDKQSQSIKYFDETKIIAGYTCKKAEIQISEDSSPLIVYYTNDIAYPKYSSPFKVLEGFPLEFEGDMGGLKTKTTAKSVKEEKVEDSKFIVPEGYPETTMKELQQMFGGE